MIKADELQRIADKLHAVAVATDADPAFASAAGTLKAYRSEVFQQHSGAAEVRHEKKHGSYRRYAEEHAKRLRNEAPNRDVRFIAKDVQDLVHRLEDRHRDRAQYYTDETINRWVYGCLREKPLRGRPPSGE